MLTGFYCINIISKNSKELIAFYSQILNMPIIKTDDDDTNGVYFGFMNDAPMLCIWDCRKCNITPTGKQSFVFSTKNLDTVRKTLTNKGVRTQEPVKYEWGTYEMRFCDTDENEVVIVEFLNDYARNEQNE